MKVPEADRQTNGEAANMRGEKLVYGFSEDPGAEDDLMALCEGKGAGLMRMRQLGLPVPVSMPGMMDTVLNLGLNDATVHGLAKSTKDQRFAHDSHRRFIQAFGEIVLKAPGHLFEEAIEEFKGERGVEADTELSAHDLEELVGRFKTIVAQEARAEFPEDSKEQLELAIGAVFDYVP